MKNRCTTPDCQGERAPKRTICYKCKSKAHRERNPKLFTFHWLKASEKKRNYIFTITFIEWCDFCDRTGYIEGRGTGGQDMTIDRIKNEDGYTIDNIQVLTKSENSSKYWQMDIKELEAAGIFINNDEPF